MIYLTIILKVKEEFDFNKVMDEFKIIEDLTKKENGCIHFHAYPANKENRQIILWEIWKDGESLNNLHQKDFYINFSNKQYAIPESVYESKVD